MEDRLEFQGKLGWILEEAKKMSGRNTIQSQKSPDVSTDSASV